MRGPEETDPELQLLQAALLPQPLEDVAQVDVDRRGLPAGKDAPEDGQVEDGPVEGDQRAPGSRALAKTGQISPEALQPCAVEHAGNGHRVARRLDVQERR